MLFQLDRLGATFQHLLSIQKEIIGKKGVLSTKLAGLKDVYTQIVKTNSKKIFLFCLDSFYFQYKILTIEMDNINRFSSLINNRMYGDYYKLYNLILAQIQEPYRAALGTDFKAYPAYKELEPFFEYPMADIIHIHHDILRLLHFLNQQFNEKQGNIQTYSDEINVGRSITSFLHTHEYENTLLREQIMLYVNYLEFFHSTQTAYMSKLFQHLDRFQREIEEEILTNYASVRPAPQSELSFQVETVTPPSTLTAEDLGGAAAIDMSPQRPPTDIERALIQQEEDPIPAAAAAAATTPVQPTTAEPTPPEPPVPPSEPEAESIPPSIHGTQEPVVSNDDADSLENTAPRRLDPE